MNGEIRIVDDVPAEFAALVEAEFASVNGTFRLAASGGASGRATIGALTNSSSLDFGRVELFFVDERCVDTDSPDSNQKVITDALGPKRDKLAAFYPMSCANGPSAYEARLRSAGRLDVVQLGLGPDGHTASLFPGSPALGENEALVARNYDALGENDFERMTLTFPGIALGSLVVITVIGAARAGVVARLEQGEDLPANRVAAARVIWLIERAAGSMLST